MIDEETLRHVWETQVTGIYSRGTMQNTKAAAEHPLRFTSYKSSKYTSYKLLFS